MDINKRIHGPCGVRLTTSDDIRFDAELFFRRLLLFDVYFLETIRFWEFPHLVKMIGYDAIIQILKSNILKIDCDPTTLADVTNLAASNSQKRKGKIKFGSYSFSTVQPADMKQYISDCLQCISSIEGITHKQKKILKRTIADNISTQNVNDNSEFLFNFRQDVISNHPVLKTALVHVLKSQKNITAEPSKLFLKFHHGSEEEDEFDSETNINDIYNFDKESTHTIIQQALLGVGGVNRRIEVMKVFNSLSGFVENELPLFENKLSFLQDIFSSENQEKQFKRVITLTGFPDFSNIATDGNFNIDKFLKVRDSEECKEFRDWLPTIATNSDKEIEEYLLSFKAKFASNLHSPTGSVIRFLVTSSLGFLGVGEVANFAIGSLDNFLVDKVMPKTGITTFINKLYPSIFK